MQNKYIKLAAAAVFVFYFSCSAKANELPDINLEILGNDDISDNIVNKHDSDINSSRIISSRHVIADNNKNITDDKSLSFNDLSPMVQNYISDNITTSFPATVSENKDTVSSVSLKDKNLNPIQQNKISEINQTKIADNNVSKVERLNKTSSVKPLKAAPNLSASPASEMPNPTLDDVNAQSSEWLDSEHSTYELSTDEIENGSTVKIDGTTYYYTPSDEDKETLGNLVATGAIALKETTTSDNAVFKLGDKYYTYDSSVLKKSIYTITEGTEDNYNFTTTDGTTTKYWKMHVKESGSNTVYKDIENASAIENIDETNADISADFINNSNMNGDGAAIYNSGSLGNITGDFIGNNSAHNGTVTNSGNIGNITGDFIQNSTTGNGGAISNIAESDSVAVINDINSNFINNTAFNGGAIYNSSELKNNISDDNSGDMFYRSAASINISDITQNSQSYSVAKIGNINGNFYQNKTEIYVALGGAIYNNAEFQSNNSQDIGGIKSSILNISDIIQNSQNISVAQIGDITGNFYENEANGIEEASGGAIYNNANLNISSGSYEDNNIIDSVLAVPLKSLPDNPINVENISIAEIGDITGNFEKNSAVSDYNIASGGAIYNNANVNNSSDDYNNPVETKVSDFIKSSLLDINSDITTAAIAKIGDIKGNFINNSAKSEKAEASGGAIYNNAYNNSSNNVPSIDRSSPEMVKSSLLSGNYSNINTDVTSVSIAEIGDITGDFINNSAETEGWNASGGAIYNNANTGFSNDFYGPVAATSPKAVLIEPLKSVSYYDENVSGSSLAVAKIGNIKGDFKNNKAVSAYNSKGGAIFNSAQGNAIAVIGNITGNFEENSAISDNSSSYGGAIYNNNAEIGDITGDFVQNTAQGQGLAMGGAIYNQNGIFGTFNSVFDSNSAVSQNTTAAGGAVADMESNSNSQNLNIHLSIRNSVNTETGESYKTYYLWDNTNNREATADEIQEAVNNGALISLSTETYTNNISNDNWDYEKTNRDYNIEIGYAYTDNPLEDLTYPENQLKYEVPENKITFKNNFVQGIEANGGALITDKNNYNIKADFENNYAIGSDYAAGGAISAVNSDNPTENMIEYNYNIITYKNTETGEEITVYYYPSDEQYNEMVKLVNKGYKINLYKNERTNTINASNWENCLSYINNEIANGYGYTTPDTRVDNITDNMKATWNNSINVINSNFRNNHAISENGEAKGGAINAGTNLNIIADNGTSTFTGNYTESNGVVEQNAIYMGNPTSALTLYAVNNGTITFDDEITGIEGYKLAINGDNTGKVVLNNKITTNNAVLDNTTLKLGVTDSANNTSDVLKNANLTVNSGIIDTVDGKYTNYNIKKLDSSENARYNIDMIISADEQKADTFTVGDDSSGIVFLSSINVNNNSEENKEYIVQIIKANGNGDTPQLKYDNSKVLDEATAVMQSDNIIADGLTLHTTETANDSIKIRGLKNTFTEWSQLPTNEDKQFTFIDNSKYTLDNNINLEGKNIEIAGNNNTLDINNKKYLDNISDEQNVKISNVKIENSNDISNKGNLSLTDTSIDADITNDNNLSLSGNSELKGNLRNNNLLKIDNAEIEFDKTITTADEGKIDITNSSVSLNNTVAKQNITIIDSDINLKDVNKFNDNSVRFDSGNLNINDLGLNTLAFNNLDFNGGNINIDSVKADLANKKMGNISAKSYGDNPQGNINVKNIIVTSDATDNTTGIKFVDKELKNNVKSNIKEVTGPVYKYKVDFSTDGEFGDDGYFKFSKDKSTDSSSVPVSYENFNSSLFVAPVAAELGGYAVLLNNYDDALRNMDMYMMMTKEQRLAYKNKNKYAAYSDVLPYDNSKTIYDNPAINTKPWTTFEKVKLKHGPKVSNVTYGTFEILESPMYEMKNGFDGIWGVYGAYNGSHQAYQGNSIYQNGGNFGVVGMAYKDNFFIGATANVGAGIANASTAFGDEDFGMFMTGVAAKAGYNFEFKNGKYVIQPSYMMSYSFINSEDYTNAAGVKIKTEPLHAISMEPGVKLVANLNNGWQPYAGVSVVMNALDKAKVKANDVSLPEVSVKPYVKYGVGVRKTIGDKAAGYLQTYVTNGGRTGVGIQAGFRWTLGKSDKTSYADSNSNKPKKYIAGSNIPVDNSKIAGK